MSIIVSALIRKRKIGSPTKKSVLLFMADFASDDGTGIWVSKSHMADDLEMGRRTVQDAIQALLVAGLIVETGTRPRSNGYTVEYRIMLKAVSSLEMTRKPDEGPDDDDLAPILGNTCAATAHVQEPHMPCAAAARQSVRQPHINRKTTVTKPPPALVAADFELDQFIGDLCRSVGIGGNPPRSWSGKRGRAHIATWLERLTAEEVLSRAKKSRVHHPDAPATPQALDGFMVSACQPERPVVASREDVLRLKAEWINGTGYLPPSAVSHADGRELVAMGLVSPARLAERGIA